MKTSNLIKLPFLLLLLLGVHLKAEDKPLWTPTDTLLIKGIELVKVSPDGEKTLFRVVEPNKLDKEKDPFKNFSRGYIVSNKTGDINPIIDDKLSFNEGDWSYDNKWLAYTTIDTDKKARLRRKLSELMS